MVLPALPLVLTDAIAGRCRVSLLRPTCDRCGVRPSTRQFQGQEYDGEGRQTGAYVSCLCETCAGPFRLAMWRWLAGAARVEPAAPPVGLTGLLETGKTKRPTAADLDAAIGRARSSLGAVGAAGKVPHPNDAHVFTGRCQLGLVCRGEGKREGMLTLVGDRWAPMLQTTNARGDTMEMCKRCADDWCANKPGSAVWRPLPKLLH